MPRSSQWSISLRSSHQIPVCTSAPVKHLKNGNTMLYCRAGQLQPTGGPHNSLRTHLRAALVYTYIKREGEGRIELIRMPLFTKISYADS